MDIWEATIDVASLFIIQSGVGMIKKPKSSRKRILNYRLTILGDIPTDLHHKVSKIHAEAVLKEHAKSSKNRQDRLCTENISACTVLGEVDRPWRE